MKRAAIVLSMAILAGCAITPRQRVDAALRNAGVPPKVATCMAERMADRLSVQQLLELKALAKDRQPGEKINAKHILKRVAALGDPEIVSVTSGAALRCYIAAY